MKPPSGILSGGKSHPRYTNEVVGLEMVGRVAVIQAADELGVVVGNYGDDGLQRGAISSPARDDLQQRLGGLRG